MATKWPVNGQQNAAPVISQYAHKSLQYLYYLQPIVLSLMSQVQVYAPVWVYVREKMPGYGAHVSQVPLH